MPTQPSPNDGVVRTAREVNDIIHGLILTGRANTPEFEQWQSILYRLPRQTGHWWERITALAPPEGDTAAAEEEEDEADAEDDEDEEDEEEEEEEEESPEASECEEDGVE